LGRRCRHAEGNRANFEETAKQFKRIENLGQDVPYEPQRVLKNREGLPEKGWCRTRELAIEHAQKQEHRQIEAAEQMIVAAERRLAELLALDESA
jgi:hypothetical protein